MLTVKAIVDLFGGTSAFAVVLGVTPQAVANMIARNSIAPRHWPTIIAGAGSRGVADVTWDAMSKLSPNARQTQPVRETKIAAGRER